MTPGGQDRGGEGGDRSLRPGLLVATPIHRVAFGPEGLRVKDDVLYQAYYEGGLRVVDVSGELMGNLYTQGREIAVFKPHDPVGYVANAPTTWSAMPHKGKIFLSDANSRLWAVELEPEEEMVP